MAVGVLLASAASAGPITWAVNGAFDDGGAISGSFIYNADLNLYSSIDVTTTAGSTLGGAHYTLSNPCCTPLSSFLLFVTTTGDLTGTPVLSVYLDGPMTDAGGTINLAIAADKLPYFSEESCSNATCGSPAGDERYVVSGDVSSNLVPEPTTWVLLAGPLAAILYFRRQRA